MTASRRPRSVGQLWSGDEVVAILSMMAERRYRDRAEQSTRKPQKAGRDATADRVDDLSSAEEEWLAYHVARAAEHAFPADERMGKTPQQDFYFRELVELVIENVFRHGAPITGGDYVAIWQFTRDRVAKFRPHSRPGRAGYRRASIKTLVHEWKAAFSRRDRSFASNGTIEFILEGPNAVSDDLVLRARIRGFRLQSGTSFEFASAELTETTRLPTDTITSNEQDADEKKRLVQEARKYVRRVESQYLAKLSDGPLEFVRDEVRELQRARRDYRRLAIAIAIALGTAMAAYRIIFTHRPIPIEVDLVNDCRGCVKSAWSDGKGHVSPIPKERGCDRRRGREA